MSIPTRITPDGHGAQGPASRLATDLPQAAHVEPFELIVEALQQRELLEPCLLLSAGYVGAPFLLRQVHGLLSPLLAILGFPIHRPEEQHAVSQ